MPLKTAVIEMAFLSPFIFRDPYARDRMKLLYYVFFIGDCQIKRVYFYGASVEYNLLVYFTGLVVFCMSRGRLAVI